MANFSRLLWTAETLRQQEGRIDVEPMADARVSIRMRTGRDDTPQVFYEIANVFTRRTCGKSRRATTADWA